MGIGHNILIEPFGFTILHTGQVARSEMIVSFTVSTDAVGTFLAELHALATDVANEDAPVGQLIEGHDVSVLGRASLNDLVSTVAGCAFKVGFCYTTWQGYWK